MTIMQLLPKATSRDSLLLACSLPAFTGQECDDLLFGKCGGTIARASPRRRSAGSIPKATGRSCGAPARRTISSWTP